MAIQVNVTGLVDVYVTPFGGDTQYWFGRTQNGAFITFEGYELRVPGDENGGDDGPPIELQYLGQTARVRLEMTKFNPVVSEMLVNRLPSLGTFGMPKSPVGTDDYPSVGTLLFAHSQYHKLYLAINAARTVASIPSIIGVNNGYRFPCAVSVRPPQEINVGTKFMRHLMEFECYAAPAGTADEGILYDNTAPTS